MNGFTVETPGPLTTIQDHGRAGFASLGVGSSGAADTRSYDLANRLVGNLDGAPALEITLGGLSVRFDATHEIVLTGAPASATINGIPFGHNSRIVVHEGDLLQVSTPTIGLRTYLAIRGGIDVPMVLGSASTDTLADLGPGRLVSGQRIAVGDRRGPYPPIDFAPAAQPTDRLSTLGIRLGPRDTWFTSESIRTLLDSTWTVTTRADRIGAELDGPLLERIHSVELPSEGVVTGALQVPPSGRPTLFLSDHPVTGGYPVIAVASRRSIDLAAQARPGQQLRFVLDK
ncbi:biotin-dependent carboxyltransferase family protein [Antrihabitans stalagmiti]|uniref:5-oxoprolinase subunit C family protein n=1 Tax=Antrihabitans stalagmiti TaxID=2799499 RepID=UPI0027DE76D5|nr:biotin-dependent carboxyltransferase family protein [Antrihabitans stalagmiti]